MKAKYPNGLAEPFNRSGLTQSALAELAGTTQQQIGRLLQGEREMTVVWARALGHALGVAPEELIFPELKRQRAPLLSWVTAGRLVQQDGVRKVDAKRFLPITGLPAGDWIVLQIEGDSMDRIAPDGALIFVNRNDRRLVDNKFYVFSTEQGEATFKRYREGSPPRLQPFSTNPDNETIFPQDGMKVVGRVRRVMVEID